MAEETPEFGGWTAGRAADDNRGIDRATDRLESEINRFSDALERLTSSLGQTGGSGNGGQPLPGAGQQTRYANGGGASFGAGQHAGPVTQAALSPSANGGAHRMPVPAAMGPSSQGLRNAGKVAGAVAAAGTLAYGANHFSSQTQGATLAQMYGGTNWHDAYQSGMTGNYTAHGNADHYAMISMMGRSGHVMGSGAGWNQTRANVQSMSAVNPTISNQQGMQASMSLSTVSSFNRLARTGINPLGAGGTGDPRSIARQLLGKMGTSRLRTKEQVFAAMGPSGSVTVTLDSYVAAGYIPAEAYEAIRSEMQNQMLAQIKGLNASEYNRLATTAGSGLGSTAEAARDRLQGMDIATKTPVQDEFRNQGRTRESEKETIRGFVGGVKAATGVLGAFREALNKILSIPGLGEVVGATGGFAGRLPFVGTALGGITGSGGGGGILTTLGSFGDGPPSMSGSQRSYAAASGAGGVGATFARPAAAAGGGGGGVSSGSARAAGSQYSLGPVKPWVAKAAAILGPKFGIRVIGGVASRSYTSDHPSGHALDFMCTKSQGDALAAYAIANRSSLNITYVIWRQRIWNIGDKGWRPMADRGSATANHMDHVHISFLRSPTNGDYSDLPSGAGQGFGGGGSFGGMGLGQGSTSPDNGSSAGFTGAGGSAVTGAFSEAGALGISGSGSAGALTGMGGGGSSLGGSDPGALGRTGGGGGGGGGSSAVSVGAGFGSGAGGTVRSGTYNVGSLKGRTNPAADLAKLTGPADVLALTEVNPQRLAALRRGLAKDNWGIYAGDGSASGSYALDASIAYDKDKYSFVKGGTYKLGDLTGNFLGGRGKRFANYALLKDKETGMSFWQVSAHTVPMANADMPHRRMHKEQFDSLDSLAEMLKKTGIPVIMGGDFNQQRNRDFWRNPGGMQSARGGGVDHVFGQTGAVKTTDLSMIGGLSGDHSGAVLATMSIKGSGGGSARAAGNGGTPSQNMALGRAMAAARGWTGAQWNDLKNLWQRESGWRTDADNPTSSAYGIPQALTELHNLGDKYKNDPKAQIQWGLNYIAGRYGNPSNAWDFWQKNNYYKQGAWKIKENKEAQIHMGEMILPSKIADVVREELAAPGIRGALSGGVKKSGGEVNVVFQTGAITVGLSGDTQQDAEQAGRWVVDAMMEDARFRALSEGR